MAGSVRQNRLMKHRNVALTLTTTAFGLAAAASLLVYVTPVAAYDRYNNGCQNCHGSFTGPVSPQGTMFPSNNKHTMHRSANYMATACNLCHTTGDGNNPFIGSSNGTANNRGLGCSGCHGHDYGGSVGVSGAGLRAHHATSGVAVCATCHTQDPTPLPEYVRPPYYGTPDTRANDSCNSPPGSNTRENWSVGDTLGLDNDGNGLYDGSDPNCARIRADLNCDGAINNFDIDPFVLALTSPDAYRAAYPSCNFLHADINSDGLVNNFDIDPFVLCLTAGGCP